MRKINVQFDIVMPYHAKDVGLCFVVTPKSELTKGDKVKHMLIQSRFLPDDAHQKGGFSLECEIGNNGQVSYPESMVHGWLGSRSRSEVSLRHAYNTKLFRTLRESSPIHRYDPDRVFNTPVLKMIGSIYYIMHGKDLQTMLREKNYTHFLERYKTEVFVPSDDHAKNPTAQTKTYQSSRVLRYYPDERAVSVLFKMVGRQGDALSLKLLPKDDNQRNILNCHRFYIGERWQNLSEQMDVDRELYKMVVAFIENNDVEQVSAI